MNSTTDRAVRANREAGNYLIIPNADHPQAFDLVKPDGTAYRTTEHSCNCPDYINRGVTCKHQHLVRVVRQQERDEATAAREQYYAEAIADRKLWE